MQAYPEADAQRVAPTASTSIATLKGLVDSVRSLRSEMGLAPGQKVGAFVAGSGQADVDVAPLVDYLKALARLSDVSIVGDRKSVV